MLLLVIIGNHRCGTSFLASCLEQLGVSIGKTRNQDKDEPNPKGYWENDVFTEMHNSLLRQNKKDWKTIRETINYSHKDVEQYIEHIRKEFDPKDAILIKDPRLTFMIPFLRDVSIRGKYDLKLLFATRERLEACHSLSKAQNIPLSKSMELFDAGINLIPSDAIVVPYHRMLRDHTNMLQSICEFTGIRHDKNTSTNIDLTLYRSNAWYPVKMYPYRSPLDMMSAIIPYIQNRSVGDLGCGAGDILEHIRRSQICKSVWGVELSDDPKYPYTVRENVFNINIPRLDVYIDRKSVV